MTRKEREEAIKYIKRCRKLDEILHNIAPEGTISFFATEKCLKYLDMAIKTLEKGANEDKSYELWKESYEIEHEKNRKLEEKIKVLEEKRLKKEIEWLKYERNQLYYELKEKLNDQLMDYRIYQDCPYSYI